MNRVVLCITCLLFLSCSLTGCSSKKELNDMGIALALAIDKKDDIYNISIQIVNPSAISAQGGSSNRSPVTTYSTSGKTIFEAIRRLTKETPRKIYFAHLRLMVISEALAREQGISNILEFLMRDPELRKDFYVLISREQSARTILSIMSPIEKIPANKIFRSLEMSERYWAPTTAIKMDELVRDITRAGKEPVLTGIQVEGSTKHGASNENANRVLPNAILHLDSVAIFRKDRLVGWLNESESKGYNYITNKVHSTVGAVACNKKEWVNIEVIHAKSHIKVRMEKGKPSIHIYFDIEGNVAEVGCKIDISKRATIARLEDKFNHRVKYVSHAAITKAHRYGTDIFGFGDLIYRTHPTEWEKLKNNWNAKGFREIKVYLHPKTHIQHTGITIQSPLKDAK
ncbi:Ger(x)C family spore germination protein [Ectobacillus antri]|jgi:spore germination protein KC|uniref:Ger(X)C family spore germination protein n=1 Tax=Ectobacillus antri TaxID=2486280 RepID=A0ABT6H6K3_9BACI|nr:Ger(x)C family spore germination protein [Ectobacillus antri]MDG4657668.1 Ger(x)C family spore germination protein [Ectobacillus antri]MDG5754675.1 Ger(x)C family spore germination protein [Ectobacillus antri]